jgi:glycosyltransferase involved in cell wall biosynthesis
MASLDDLFPPAGEQPPALRGAPHGRADLVIVVPQLDPAYGMERALLNLLEHLTPEGHLHVLALSGGAPDVPPGTPWSFETLGLPRGGQRFPRAAWQLARRLRALRPTTVVASGLWAAIPTLLAAPAGTDVVVWEHSLMPQRIADEPAVRAMSRAAGRLYPRARSVVAVSGVVGDCVRQLLGPDADVRVVPNVVRLPGAPGRPRAASVDRGLHLLSVGRLTAGKNQQLAVAALAHLPADTRLTLLGDGPQREALQAQAQALGVADRVELAGYRADAPAFFTATDVVVHPSFAESFGLVGVEAAWAGRPVAALDRAALNELVPRYCPGRLAATPTPRDLARAIREAAALAGSTAVFEACRREREALLDPASVTAAWHDVLAGPSASRPAVAAAAAPAGRRAAGAAAGGSR